MITIPELAAEALGSRLAEHLDRRFGSTDKGLIELVQSAARLALDCIGNSDALYHNFEHTMLVTLCGYDIVRGRMLRTPTNASDFAHILIACLFHDIGYVRGILKGDSPDGYIIDAKGNKTKLPRGSSDAALLPYHVDRSKLFVMDRIGEIEALDAIRIANAIEFTRFPVVPAADANDNEDGMLVRAADLIGQLGDPHYLRKANALYYEFEEVGMNKQLGYTSPADLTDLYPHFFWSSISPHIQSAISYLNVTSSGRSWIANFIATYFVLNVSSTYLDHSVSCAVTDILWRLSALLQKGFKLLVSVKCQKQTFCATAKTGTPSPRRSARQLNKLREIRRNLPRFIP